MTEYNDSIFKLTGKINGNCSVRPEFGSLWFKTSRSRPAILNLSSCRSSFLLLLSGDILVLELRLLIQSKPFALLCLSETWLHVNIEDGELALPGC